VICLDASVVAKLVLYEERSDRAVALYREAILTGEPLVAPPLLHFELTNIIRKQMRGLATISLEDALHLLRDVLSLEIQLLFPAELPVLALTIADALNLSATYDAQYIALAEQLGWNSGPMIGDLFDRSARLYLPCAGLATSWAEWIKPPHRWQPWPCFTIAQPRVDLAA
jgi:predicted nucleic acid-binding protein